MTAHIAANDIKSLISNCELLLHINIGCVSVFMSLFDVIVDLFDIFVDHFHHWFTKDSLPFLVCGSIAPVPYGLNEGEPGIRS